MLAGPDAFRFALSADAIAELVEQTKAATYGLGRARVFALWRNIVERFPNEPALARQFLTELSLSDAWAEIDAETAWFEAFGDEAIDLELVDNATSRLLFELAEARLRGVVARHGQSPRTDIRAYELALLKRDYAGAMRHARSLRGKAAIPGRDGVQLERKARFYQRLERKWKAPASARSYDLLLINLDADTMRLERMRRQLPPTDFQRIPAVRGSYLPEHVLREVTRNRGHHMKGTIGCFMSHVMAWERVAASGRDALVLEDDACLLGPLPRDVAELGLPRDYHVCFVNERMMATDFAYAEAGHHVISAETAAGSKHDGWSAAGTDGYFISPGGARELLSLIETDGLAGDVDWRLVSYALTHRTRRALIAQGGFRGDALDFHEPVRDAQTIRAYVLHPALVRQFDGGSVRLWDNSMPHAHHAVVTEKLAARRP